jgi:hypothetical protein
VPVDVFGEQKTSQRKDIVVCCLDSLSLDCTRMLVGSLDVHHGKSCEI